MRKTLTLALLLLLLASPARADLVLTDQNKTCAFPPGTESITSVSQIPANVAALLPPTLGDHYKPGWVFDAVLRRAAHNGNIWVIYTYEGTSVIGPHYYAFDMSGAKPVALQIPDIGFCADVSEVLRSAKARPPSLVGCWMPAPVRQIWSMQELPARIRDDLQGIADIGKPFISGDVVGTPGLPNAGLIMAGHNQKYWFTVVSPQMLHPVIRLYRIPTLEPVPVPDTNVPLSGDLCARTSAILNEPLPALHIIHVDRNAIEHTGEDQLRAARDAILRSLAPPGVKP